MLATDQPFIVSSADVPETTHRYPSSDEPMAPARAIGRAAGLRRIGLHVQRVPSGARILGHTPRRRRRSCVSGVVRIGGCLRRSRAHRAQHQRPSRARV